MLLEHYTAAPLDYEPGRVYRQEEAAPYGKPHGLWLSVPGPDDWPAWCLEEGFRVGELVERARFTLRPGGKVLVIQDRAALLDFTYLYAVRVRESEVVSSAAIGGSWAIDWRAVAGAMDGVIVAPYRWDCRLEMDSMWYYGWDAASGCVWNLDAVERID